MQEDFGAQRYRRYRLTEEHKYYRSIWLFHKLMFKYHVRFFTNLVLQIIFFPVPQLGFARSIPIVILYSRIIFSIHDPPPPPKSYDAHPSRFSCLYYSETLVSFYKDFVPSQWIQFISLKPAGLLDRLWFDKKITSSTG